MLSETDKVMRGDEKHDMGENVTLILLHLLSESDTWELFLVVKRHVGGQNRAKRKRGRKCNIPVICNWGATRVKLTQ